MTTDQEKVGYSRDTAPKNNSRSSKQPLLRCEGRSLRPPHLEKIFCLAPIMGESPDSGYSPGLDRMGFCRVVKNGLLCN